MCVLDESTAISAFISSSRSSFQLQYTNFCYSFSRKWASELRRNQLDFQATALNFFVFVIQFAHSLVFFFAVSLSHFFSCFYLVALMRFFSYMIICRCFVCAHIIQLCFMCCRLIGIVLYLFIPSFVRCTFGSLLLPLAFFHYFKLLHSEKTHRTLFTPKASRNKVEFYASRAFYHFNNTSKREKERTIEKKQSNESKSTRKVY